VGGRAMFCAANDVARTRQWRDSTSKGYMGAHKLKLGLPGRIYPDRLDALLTGGLIVETQEGLVRLHKLVALFYSDGERQPEKIRRP